MLLIELIYIFRGQLQLILWLECLRIHAQTGSNLPEIELIPVKTDTKKKGRKKTKPAALTAKEYFEKGIFELMDRLCIWSILLPD